MQAVKRDWNAPQTDLGAMDVRVGVAHCATCAA